MSVPILFLISSLFVLGGKAFTKLCSNLVTQNSAAKYSVVLIVNCLVACLFFWLFSRGKIAVNETTVWYSVIYAAVVAASVILNLIIYRYTTISNVNVITSASSMICTVLIGWWIFSEDLGFLDLLRLFVMLVAIFFVLLDQRKLADGKKMGEKKKGSSVFMLLIIAAMTVVGGVNTAVIKSFTVSDAVTDENSFFFFTNVFLCLGASVAFLIGCLRKKGELRNAVALLRPRALASIAGNTVCSNVSSVVSVMILAQMDVSIYSPISTALGVIVGLIGSLIFRERLGAFSYIAAAVACAAMLI